MELEHHKAAINALMESLHRRQLEVMELLMDELRTGKWRRSDIGSDIGSDSADEVMVDGVEERFSELKVDRTPNIVAMLIKHILIFRDVGNGQKADEILYSAVSVGVGGKRKSVNRQSLYFAKFETVRFGENDVISLL